jgi:ppGpp synthetase/RelA/SpoT-type nucleotidyltranferase
VSKKTPEEWGKMYEDQIDKYHKFEERLASLIHDLIEEDQIEIAQITSRTKGKGSFIDKIIRKSYENPFTQCTDLAACRIFCNFGRPVIPHLNQHPWINTF